ncbi:hypothetical protein NL321_28465, partial [Klebsiella pneumoniae]|nr:hypothetical protein [Klebsiella pneumoniae]
MSSSLNECWDAGSSNGCRQSRSPLSEVDATMPTPPGLRGGEHTSTTTHVTEGTLTGPMGTTTTDTR